MICLKDKETKEFLEIYKSLSQINDYLDSNRSDLPLNQKEIPQLISNARKYQEYCPEKFIPEIEKVEKFYNSLEKKFK